jgi:hypothetical protein
MKASVAEKIIRALTEEPWVEPSQAFKRAGVEKYHAYGVLGTLRDQGKVVRRIVNGVCQYRAARPGEMPSIYDPQGEIDTYPLAQCFGGLSYLNQVKETRHGIRQ